MAGSTNGGTPAKKAAASPKSSSTTTSGTTPPTTPADVAKTPTEAPVVTGGATAGGPSTAPDTSTAGPSTTPDVAGTAKPEPHDTSNQSPTTEGQGVAPAADVQAQRSGEEREALDAAAAKGEGGSLTPAEKGQQTRAAADVKAQAEADAEARAEAVVDTSDPLAPNYSRDSDDPVQAQRKAEAEAAKARALAASGDADLTEKDRLLLAAAPGGARTALTDGREGSTTVTHTAAQARSPLSGPLHHPVNDIENLAATEDDPDNRVYADEAGPRDVFTDTEPTKARYQSATGEPLTYDGIFEDPDGAKTFVVTKVRVYETFLFPNTTTVGKRLAYAAGKKVPRGEAENVRQQISVHSPIM